MSGNILKIKNLRVAYGAIQALHGVSLAVPRGKVVCLIGANGAGKSTVLRAVSGLLIMKTGNNFLGQLNFHIAGIGAGGDIGF